MSYDKTKPVNYVLSDADIVRENENALAAHHRGGTAPPDPELGWIHIDTSDPANHKLNVYTEPTGSSSSPGGSPYEWVTMIEHLESIPVPVALPAHAAEHETGGVDELSIVGLSGLAGDAQTPLAHKVSHQDGGADELNVGALSGELADPQPPKTHASTHSDGNADEITVEALATGGAAGTVLTSQGGGVAAMAAPPALTAQNEDMVCNVTSSDGDAATATAITATPNGAVRVFVNGDLVSVGNGVKTKFCYFSGDGGTTARAQGAIVSGDTCHWNGSLASFELDANDRITFVYEV